MIYKCINQNLYKIEVKGEQVLELNQDWYIDVVAYPGEYPIDWLDITIRKKEESTNENESIYKNRTGLKHRTRPGRVRMLHNKKRS